MITVSNVPTDENTHQPHAAWATKRRVIPDFVLRRLTGAIIRLHSSLGSLALAVCLASGLGLLILALMAARNGY